MKDENPMLPSIVGLYQAFDRVFSRPTFLHHGFYCCVSPQEERLLLKTPRKELTEIMLANPVDHLGVCFSTPEQGSYFVPRLVELLSETEDGFRYGMLHSTFYRLIRNNEQLYRASGVWNALESALRDIFRERTSAFIFNAGWADSVSCASFIDGILNGFFYPILSKRQDQAEEAGQTDWDEFFACWAEEQNAARIAHLLELVRLYCMERIGWHFEYYSLPGSFLKRLGRRSFQQRLLAGVEPLSSREELTRWKEDVLACLWALEAED